MESPICVWSLITKVFTIWNLHLLRDKGVLEAWSWALCRSLQDFVILNIWIERWSFQKSVGPILITCLLRQRKLAHKSVVYSFHHPFGFICRLHSSNYEMYNLVMYFSRNLSCSDFWRILQILSHLCSNLADIPVTQLNFRRENFLQIFELPFNFQDLKLETIYGGSCTKYFLGITLCFLIKLAFSHYTIKKIHLNSLALNSLKTMD